MSTKRLLTKEELNKYTYNPELTQREILKLIDKAYDEDVVLTNATNPFNMLLEATAITASNAATEAFNITRKRYANLALSREDLWHHLSDDEILGVYSSPGSVELNFKVSVTDMISHGVRPTGAKYVECIIPERTKIRVHNTDLTLLNDIVVKYYDNQTSFVEMQPNDNPVSTKDTGVIYSVVALDDDGSAYIMFDLKVQQLSLTVNRYNIISSEGFNKTIPLQGEKNRFYYMVVRNESALTSGNSIRLPINYNDEYLDPYTPSAYVKVIDNNVTDKLIIEAVNVTIPDIYFLNNSISGTIIVELYETLGNIYLPLTDTLASDFDVTLGLVGKNTSTAAMNNINLIVQSMGTITDGTSGRSFEELRQAIIFNTKGNQYLPITDYQLSFNNILDGFNIVKDNDIITGRSYVALRNLTKEKREALRALQDVYFNTISILLTDYPKHRYLAIHTDNFTIKSGAVFSETNSIVSLVQEEQLEAMAQLSILDKIEYFKAGKYFITPYYYVVSIKDSQSAVSVYDLDRPILKDKVLTDVNREIPQRCNSVGHNVIKTKNGYRVIIKVEKNNEAKEIPEDKFKVVLALDLVTENTTYIPGSYHADEDIWVFDIDTDYYIDRDDEIRLTSGNATTLTKMSKLFTSIALYYYTTDDTISDPLRMLRDSLPYERDPYIVITRETFKFIMGNRLNNIWDKLAISYTERRYARYENDVPAYYEENILEPKPGSGWLVEEKNGSLVGRFIHKKGDPVLDDEGHPVFKHKKGDVILNNKGIPVIDGISGMIRHLDICMLDYEFYLATNPAYAKYNALCLDELREYMLKILPSKMDNLLENTTLKYKSYKTSSPVKVRINDVIYGLNPYIKPTVTIYYNQNQEYKLTNTELEKTRDLVGFIIDKYLENDTIKLTEIRENIMKVLGESVLTVKIVGIDPYNSELLILEDKSKRLAVNKELVINEYNQLEVKYDVTLQVQTL